MMGSRSRYGFTMIEVMFATGILLLTLVLLGGVVSRLAALNQIAVRQEIATTHFASALEEIRALDHKDLQTFRPTQPQDLGENGRITVECVSANGDTYALPVVQELSDAQGGGRNPAVGGGRNPAVWSGIREVRVSVTWTAGLGWPGSITGSALVEP